MMLAELSLEKLKVSSKINLHSKMNFQIILKNLGKMQKCTQKPKVLLEYLNQSFDVETILNVPWT